jgi:hypothetical protein
MVVGWADIQLVAPLGGSTTGRPPAVTAEPPKPNLENDLRILAERRPWGTDQPTQAAAAPTGNAPAAEPGSWRVGGIMRVGNVDFLVVLIQPQPNAAFFFRYLSIGDSLPDGRVIERMAEDSVQVRKGDQTSTLRLYRRPAG